MIIFLICLGYYLIALFNYVYLYPILAERIDMPFVGARDYEDGYVYIPILMWPAVYFILLLLITTYWPLKLLLKPFTYLKSKKDRYKKEKISTSWIVK